ncbi:DUF2235 domain-containing protein [Stagnihabitans tardus]|uniref:T6SS Phospholipase effector Tle1-like catalytic domain-containing protein n=1 Tax=Stagnihabitans tardus TaxID=2699202 RepID=A0AAE4Y9S4_9RHOB|nr:DUF2235 domain-containing protein [Stagnihabitans tardus]NBZ87308.1 hypothetical protein [Stagnihabitans tardus]
MSEPARKLVIFADGTANAYGGSSTNVWRMYQALDTANQRGRYFRGVGTSSNRYLRAIDGALGLGVPSTVRKAYRFLCWNYRPGDEIHLVGFSRGAFTVRTLAGMIAFQGLMPREIDGHAVTNEEMRRNTRGAWRAYRTQTAPLTGWRRFSLATIGRPLIETCSRFYRRMMGYKTHDQVETARDQGAIAPGQVKIAFMGLYDTVEAYGLPVKELLAAFDQFLWPITFRNHKVAGCVQVVRHALSLDDCRLTFHPVHCERKTPDQDIKEVWFAGSHADVGGGYPDDALAFQPLVWMADAAALRFNEAEVAKWGKRLTPAALTHDSRSGAASFYRFAPRRIAAPGAEDAALPLLHPSVREKIHEGNDGYGPVSLYRSFAWEDGAAAPPLAPRARDLAALQVITDRCQLATLILLLLSPQIGPWLAALLPWLPDPAIPGAAAIVKGTPFYLKPHVQVVVDHPVIIGLLLVLLVGLNRLAGWLGSAVQDEARVMWQPGLTLAPSPTRDRLVRLGAWLRARKTLRAAVRLGAAVAMPLLFFAGAWLMAKILLEMYWAAMS